MTPTLLQALISPSLYYSSLLSVCHLWLVPICSIWLQNYQHSAGHIENPLPVFLSHCHMGAPLIPGWRAGLLMAPEMTQIVGSRARCLPPLALGLDGQMEHRHQLNVKKKITSLPS